MAHSRRSLLTRAAIYGALLALVVLGPWGERGARLGPLQARATAGILGFLGVDVASFGDTVTGSGFAMRIAPVCDGLDLAIILSLAMLVAPVPVRARVVGVALALVGSQIFNLGRLVAMFMVGVYFPASFDLVHHVVWQVVTIVVAVWAYVAWMDRVGLVVDARQRGRHQGTPRRGHVGLALGRLSPRARAGRAADGRCRRRRPG
ncbi:MAG: hypothetical protein E6J72_07750 [Deltaproteobacteria bacterium]|nr:MAG: hypothetical protein E6J72_07750 [Deltaproteobacteria bacterium]